ncbi:MAG: hypothetical protein QOJ48_630 [Frankiales bacterium]|nr:hypothetical protein [Frankiales bacterium]
MNELPSFLQSQVASALPPPFDRVLRRVRRRRQRQALGAAIGVLVVVGGVALAAGTTTPSARPQPATTTAPDTIVVDGKTLHRDALTAIRSLSAKTRSDHLLTLVGGQRERYGPTHCFPWTVPFVLRQTPTTVVIAAYDYVLPSPPGAACFAFALGPATLTVDLGRALGGRTVVDALHDRTVGTVVESDYLTSEQLPEGYGDRVAMGSTSRGFTVPRFSQVWRRGGAQLGLVEGPPAEVLNPHVQHVATVEVRHTTGELVRTAGGDVDRCLRWHESASDALELCSSSGAATDVLAVEQLLAFADSLSRPSPKDVRQQAPASIEVQGERLEVQGGAAFRTAYLDPSRPRDLVIHRTPPSSVGKCFAWPVLRVVSQRQDAVEIAVFEYQVAKPVCFDAMPDIRADASYLRVTLDAPLGGRRLYDAGGGGLEALVVDPQRWLTVGYLPSGYTSDGQLPLSGERGGGGEAVVSQDWAGDHGLDVLTLKQGQATAPGGGPVSHVTVRGHLGTYSSSRASGTPVRCLNWLEAARDRVVLCGSHGSREPALPDSELLRIAEALHLP